MTELSGVFQRREAGELRLTRATEIHHKRPAVAHFSVGRLITTANNLQEVASHVAGALHELVDARLVIVVLIDGDDLLMASAEGNREQVRSGRMVGAAAAHDAWMHMGAPARLEGATDAVIESVRRDLISLLGVTHLDDSVAWPLTVDDHVLGSIILVPRHQIHPGSVEWETLSDAARLAALSVSNALHHQQAVLAAARRSAAEERERLARDLHDSVTQSLYSLVIQAEAWRRQIESGRLEPSLQQIAELGELGRLALREARLAIFDLFEDEQPAQGLIAGLLRRLSMVEQRAGITARVLFIHGGRTRDLTMDAAAALPISELELAPQVTTELLAFIYEALNNALKHAAATEVEVAFVLEGTSLSVRISDNGRGFDPDSIELKRGFGLRSMHERVSRLGGSLTLHSVAGGGAMVKAEAIPIQPGGVLHHDKWRR